MKTPKEWRQDADERFLRAAREHLANPVDNLNVTLMHLHEQIIREAQAEAEEDALRTWNDLDRPVCEGCEEPALYSDSEGVPLCLICAESLAAEVEEVCSCEYGRGPTPTVYDEGRADKRRFCKGCRRLLAQCEIHPKCIARDGHTDICLVPPDPA